MDYKFIYEEIKVLRAFWSSFLGLPAVVARTNLLVSIYTWWNT
jgi:hypothetical protein